MTNPSDFPNLEDDKDPVESTGSNHLIWIKLLLILVVASVAAMIEVVALGSISGFIDPSHFDDPMGVRTASFAMCVAVMLSLTMIDAGDGQDAKSLDLLV